MLGWFLWLADSDSERGLGSRVTEAWVGLDLRLYARHGDGDLRLGAGLGRVDEDPTSAQRVSLTAYGAGRRPHTVPALLIVGHRFGRAGPRYAPDDQQTPRYMSIPPLTEMTLPVM